MTSTLAPRFALLPLAAAIAAIATLAGTALLPLVVAIGLAPSPVEANFLIDTAEAQQGQGQGQGGGRDLLNIGRGKGNGFGAGG
ncbi:hypothetical protein IOC61_17555, partial [Halomonas sp. KAO]|uniref:hypothetical protein n=1 Tax=Halomonas sp. KAO TaxID=2783858 RepID=UPI00189D01E0